MPIKLLVTRAGGGGEPDEHVFDQPAVSIGRDNANLLTLTDPARVVSKQHAEVRDTGTGFELVDLGSKNFTYLNGRRLTSGEPALLHPGDAFTIGDFELRFYPEAPASPELDRTVFAASFVNPFEEPAEQLAGILGDLRRVYATEGGPHRDEALREALETAMIGGGDEPDAILAALLRGEAPASGPGAVPAPSPGWTPEPPARPETPPPAFDLPDATTPEPPPPGPAYAEAPFGAGPDYARPGGGSELRAPDSRTDRLLDTLVAAVARLVAIPWQFRHEFIGQTMAQTDEVAFLFEKSPDELKDFLLDPRAGAGELERRLGAIEEASEAAVVHQLAMLDGYKASVQEGAKRLLAEVDPEPVEVEVEASGPMYKLPQLRGAAVVERLKETHRELSGEDWSVAERRAFRPAFIKAYLARMTRRRS